MEISLSNRTNVSFKKRQIDGTYWAMKNPEKLTNFLEREYIESLIQSNPNWEQDEEFVHRLKQDTIRARMMGELRYKWHEFDTPPVIGVMLGIALFCLSAYFLRKKEFSKLSNFNKVLFPVTFLSSPFLVADSLKYILTGRTLFEKKDNMTKSNDQLDKKA